MTLKHWLYDENGNPVYFEFENHSHTRRHPAQSPHDSIRIFCGHSTAVMEFAGTCE